MTLAELALLSAVVLTGLLGAGVIAWVHYWAFVRVSHR
jgi:hypothetical protein